MSDKDWLAEVKERAEAATKGPWEPCTEFKEGRGWLAIGPQTETGGHDDCEGDAYFIASARTDVPRLVAVVEAGDRLEKMLARMVTSFPAVYDCPLDDCDNLYCNSKRALAAYRRARGGQP